MPQTSQPLSKEYLLSQVSEIPELSIESSDNKGLVVWDDEDAKLLPVHFPEAMTVDDLVQRIHISSDIPEWYRADKKALAEYLWKACDHNAFITMNEVVVVWSQPDDAGTYMSFDFEDEQRKRLHEEYSDEYAYEIGEGVLGQLWFERNTAVVNMGEIVRTADEVATENEDLVVIDPFFSFENQVQTGFLTTVLHELRHLQMDTNIFLPEDMYPLELASENAVEEYCREAFEAHPINDGILPNIDAAPKQSIQAILDKAHDLMMYCDTGLIDNASDLSPLYTKSSCPIYRGLYLPKEWLTPGHIIEEWTGSTHWSKSESVAKRFSTSTEGEDFMLEYGEERGLNSISEILPLFEPVILVLDEPVRSLDLGVYLDVLAQNGYDTGSCFLNGENDEQEVSVIGYDFSVDHVEYKDIQCYVSVMALDRKHEEELAVKPSLADQIECAIFRAGEPHASSISPEKLPNTGR